ncbi:hypothetical protein MVEN_00865300 [Mycena venus]|uniref:Uncharacterized protein n=1 Tax=Mycena venus TaxID=2733690 RepID=A0A8H6YFR5_9AGAR|nr:hypothetical protein MVEN_00865300 [Mycena venus]
MNVPKKLSDDHDKRWYCRCRERSLCLFPPTSHFSAILFMARFRSHVTLVTAVVLWFWAPGILPMKITGPSSGQPNGTVTFTWTSDSSDPTIFEIDIDEELNSLLQSDPYWIINNLNTADGSATVTLPDLLVGTHRIAFSSNDGFQILDEGSIEILAASSSSVSSSSAPTTSKSVPPPPPVSKPPTTSSTTPISSSSQPFSTQSFSTQSFSTQSFSTQSSAQSSSTQSQTATSGAQQSVFPSPAPTSALPESLPTQSQIAASGPQPDVTKRHSNAGAIAGGVVGGAVVILLALLGWWYFHRRSGSAAAGESYNDISASPQFLAVPVSSALAGNRPVHNGSNNHEFRPWEDNERSAISSTATPVSATASASTRNQPVMYRDAPTQPDHGPSREDLLQEVERLRAHIGAIPPPAYSGE